MFGLYKGFVASWCEGINYLHDYRNDPYAQALIEQLGVSVHQVALDSQHFQNFK